MTKAKVNLPDWGNYVAPQVKDGVPITREHYTFDERVMLMMKDRHPDRSDALIRSSVSILYSLSGWSPSDGEPSEYTENYITNLLVMSIVEEERQNGQDD